MVRSGSIGALACALTLGACRDSKQGATLSPAESSASATTVVASAFSASTPSSTATAATAATAARETRALPRLEGNWIEKLDVPNSYAIVTPPIGATEPRPIVISIHGAVDDPGFQCSAWRLIVDSYPFVVCPAGARVSGTTHAWASVAMLEERVLAAIEAIKTKWGPYVNADAPVVYVAFSQGATIAGPFLAKFAARFPRVVLTEGGYRAFAGGGVAERYVASGGARVLFTCSHPGCADAFGASRAALERAGANVRTEYSGSFGHTMAPGVRRSIHSQWPWVIEGLQGWESYDQAPKLSDH